MYEQDFENMTLDEIIKYAGLDLDNFPFYEDFEIKETLEWFRLEHPDEEGLETALELLEKELRNI